MEYSINRSTSIQYEISQFFVASLFRENLRIVLKSDSIHLRPSLHHHLRAWVLNKRHGINKVTLLSLLNLDFNSANNNNKNNFNYFRAATHSEVLVYKGPPDLIRLSLFKLTIWIHSVFLCNEKALLSCRKFLIMEEREDQVWWF